MSDPAAPVIMWFRLDLRLTDNPALLAARDTGRPVIPVFVLDQEEAGDWKMGAASLWWLHHSLASLSDSLKAAGAPLVLLKGRAKTLIPELANKTGAYGVYWNRRYEPWAKERDTTVKDALKDQGVQARSFNGSLLAEPWRVLNKSGEPYKVYSPYFRALEASGFTEDPAPQVRSLNRFGEAPEGEALFSWGLLPTKPNWAKEFENEWRPGEGGAKAALSEFLRGDVAAYKDRRDFPGERSTSRLSPHLHFGEISPRQVRAAVIEHVPASKGREHFIKELGWREFSYNLLHHFPGFPEKNFQKKFDRFPWKDDDRAFSAWTRGMTGYPIVDAGMRELWATGWMHNRVRMIVASFLIKHLLIDWRRGEAWFWDTLVDADLANNSASWQWVAGSGADAAPYFRIFNPVTQGEKFDPDGAYVRKWAPEIKSLPDKFIHAPWTADTSVLRRAGVTLGETYPRPIVDHAEARDIALAAFNKIKDAA
jgi:deoxyribodipyrimidine photo-lyase